MCISVYSAYVLSRTNPVLSKQKHEGELHELRMEQKFENFVVGQFLQAQVDRLSERGNDPLKV